MNNLDAVGAFVGASWKWLIDSSPFLGVLVAIVTAAIALRAIRQSAKDGDHRTRPVVAAEFQLSRESDSSMDLVVRNYGLSMARALTVSFDRPVTNGSGDHGGGGIAIKNRYLGRTISVLSPGQELRNTWWLGTSSQGHGRLVNYHDTPDEVVVTVAYTDLNGKRYSDPFSLHVDDFLYSSASVSSTSMRGRMGLISAALDGIKASTKRMADYAEYGQEANQSWVPMGETVVNGPATLTSASIPEVPIFPETKPSLPKGNNGDDG